MLRKLSALLLGLTLLLASTAGVWAQSFPTGPVTLVVPWAAGGGTDTKARILAPVLEKHLGVPVRVQVMPGAGAAVGTRHVAQSRPDGYTLLMAGLGSNVIKPLWDPVGYDQTSFRAVALITMEPALLVVRQDARWADMEEFIEYARANPRAIRYGTAGAGSNFHLFQEMANRAVGMELTHIPFNGTSEALTALLGGHIDAVVSYLGTVQPHLEAGTLRALVVGSRQRLAELPDTPTYVELGYDVETVGFDGIMAPAGTPMERVRILEEAVLKTLQDPEFIEPFARTGAPIVPMGSDDFQALFEQLYVNMAPVVEQVK